MKKSLFLFTLILLNFSCTEDFTNPSNLVGTTWKATDFSHISAMNNYEYFYFKFSSTTNVQGFIKIKDSSNELNTSPSTYSISGKTISLFIDGDLTNTGTINGNNMKIYSSEVSGEYIIFTKQK